MFDVPLVGFVVPVVGLCSGEPVVPVGFTVANVFFLFGKFLQKV
jgi:hypothetical protein